MVALLRDRARTRSRRCWRCPAEERFLQNTLWNLLTAGRLTVDVAFALDQLSMMMVLIITGIGTLIHVFSIGYMADEPAYWRFFSYLNLFVFAMLLLVMGDNFAVMFFGWEGVGLASYLLIAFWYTDPEKAAAGMKAFVVNRFGDFGFLAGLFLLFWALGGAWQPRAGALRNHRLRPGRRAERDRGRRDRRAVRTRSRRGYEGDQGRPDDELPRAARPDRRRGDRREGAAPPRRRSGASRS